MVASSLISMMTYLAIGWLVWLSRIFWIPSSGTEKMAPINDALVNLKKAHAAQDLDACKAGLETLNTAFQAASQEMYAAQQEAGGTAEGAAGQPAGEATGDDAEVTDVDFEEVKDN